MSGVPVVVVHGGAGAWRGLSLEEFKAMVRALEEAVYGGLEVSRSGDCVDMVVEAVARLEDSGVFNAGLGSVLDYSGSLTMDAGIMAGSGGAGGVAVVSYPRNPIKLARIVMEKTPHVIIAGPWADELARKLGLEAHPGPSARAIERWRKLKLDPSASPWVESRVKAARALGYDTVGAVASDGKGCLAAGVSTGGVALKLPGRVGDSPIPGAGFYATPRIAVAATGIGETIILSMASLKLSEYYEKTGDVEKAATMLVEEHTRIWGQGTIGVIAVTGEAEVAAKYNTEAMPWAYARLGEKPTINGLPNTVLP
ncbi:MAG: isoaspartyl peptidase/L-asparaginase [Thermoprotei archaeon]|nr:isoaspartyl peptidase/L-asparaginase [Thermoprotei archaeon]